MKQKHHAATEQWQVAEGAGYRYRLGKRGVRFSRAYTFNGRRYQSGKGMEHVREHDAAAKFIEHEIADLERGLALAPSDVLLMPVADEWAARQTDRRMAGRVEYLRKYVDEVLGQNVTLQEASDWRWLRRLLDSYERGECSLDGNVPHKNSVKKFFDAMRRMYGHALVYYEDSIAINPAEQMPRDIRPKGGKAAIRHTLFESVAEVERCIAMADEFYPANADFIATIAYLGTRRGETLGLKTTDIDFKTNTITFHSQFTSNGANEWAYLPYLKGQEHLPEDDRRPLIVDIPPKLRPRLLKACERSLQKGTPWVFPALDGKTPKYNNIPRMLTKLGARLGKPRLSTHDFRHTALSLMAPHATDADTLRDAANHTDKRTTELYIHDLRREDTRRGAVTELRKAAGLGH